jgi:asparagine synthase (glutamine-hydrolysing)
VKSHLIGEVPIALLLSGGVDSSILAAILHRLDAPMACFNIGFPEVNEFAYSSAVAQKYGFPLHNIEITQDELVACFPRILAELDEPIADPAQFPLYLLCRHVRQHATVVLSGEGADELFGGYPQYLTHELPLSGRERLPHFLQSSYYFLDGDQFMRRVPVDGGWRRTVKYFRGDTVLGAMSNYDLSTWIPENLMMKADKMAMRHSLEGRFPYLNRQLVALVRSLPPKFLIAPDGEFKKILKDSFAPLLPESILKRPKMGFTVPVHLLLDKFCDLYLDALASLEKSEFAELVDLAAFRGLFERFLGNDRGEALRNWTLFVLTTWVAGRCRTPATL